MLSLLAKMYGTVVRARNYLYDNRVFEIHDLGARTISVGNITTGGTGKTPLVAYIANVLAERGEKVCILTRGYGRGDESRRVLVSDGEAVLVDAATGGDEPVELAHWLLGKAIVIADADRLAAAEWAKRKFDVTAFVLDDGFQHRKAKRDLDIACVDATNPFGGHEMLPAGRLREPITSLSRADVVVITRAEQVDISDLRSQISHAAPSAVTFKACTTLTSVTSPNGEEMDRATPAFAFCGLGNPDVFYEMLRSGGYAVVRSRSFRDHHIYSQTDVSRLEADAAACGAVALVTTAKDDVKLAEFELRLPRYVARIRVEIDRASEFEESLVSGPAYFSE